ncbi:MAG: helix-turn-helix domain-containing protein [Thermodesulfovibrionales bacterium]|jgi:hypothetical protein
MALHDKNYLDVNDISRILKTRPKTVYNWAELGLIPSYKFNGCLRFDPDRIEKWIDSCRNGPKRDINPST